MKVNLCFFFFLRQNKVNLRTSTDSFYKIRLRQIWNLRPSALFYKNLHFVVGRFAYSAVCGNAYVRLRKELSTKQRTAFTASCFAKRYSPQKPDQDLNTHLIVPDHFSSKYFCGCFESIFVEEYSEPILASKIGALNKAASRVSTSFSPKSSQTVSSFFTEFWILTYAFTEDYKV